MYTYFDVSRCDGQIRASNSPITKRFGVYSMAESNESEQS